MRSKSPGARCAKHLLRRVLLATLLSAAALSQAQEPDIGQPPEPGNSVTDGTDTTATDERERISPFEYEASEQISEDLPVSFPVDI